MTSPFPSVTHADTPMKVSLDGGITWIMMALTDAVLIAIPDFDEDDTGPMDLIVGISKTEKDLLLSAERVERDGGTQRSSVVYDRNSLFDVMS